jgi:hypothetical protein
MQHTHCGCAQQRLLLLQFCDNSVLAPLCGSCLLLLLLPLGSLDCLMLLSVAAVPVAPSPLRLQLKRQPWQTTPQPPDHPSSSNTN